MSNTRYSVYRNNTLDLIRTLVVKNEMTAEAINTDLTERGYDVSDIYPDTWRYYKNLAGEYHLTDTPMTVVSLDTLDVIAFTTANLLNHRTTARGYRYGTRYYRELVARFPTQENLILGILNPIDKTKAIAAADGEILYYNPALVEENEYNLIPKLQEWINVCYIRYNVADYRYTDDLYAASFLGVMFSLMPGVVMAIRTGNCKTNQAHSYHIREYLASNGRLDVYTDILDKRTQLFLYRNIKYIHHNAGKASTFALLVDRILSKRNFPLAAYEMRHNVSGMPTALTPTIELVQSPLNLQQVEGRDEIITVREMLEKESGQARDNAINLEDDLISITERMSVAYSDRVLTKVLESVVIDNADDGPYQLIDTLLNQWIYLADRGYYNGVVAFVDPSNGETITLSTRDAFIFYLYCVNGSVGITPSILPEIQALNVRRLNIPTLSELQSMVDGDLLSDAFLNTLIDGVLPITITINSENFYLQSRAIHTRLLLHRLQYSSIEHQEAAGMARGAAWRFYIDATVHLASTETLYTDWLNDHGLGDGTYSIIDFGKLAANILIAATGMDAQAAISLKDIQAGSLRLMAQLSSYTVQYIPTINTTPYVSTEWTAIRQGKILIHEHSQDFLKNLAIQPLDLRAHMKADVLHSAVYEVRDYDWEFKDRLTIALDPNLPIETRIAEQTHIYSPMTSLDIMGFTATYHPPLVTVVPLSFRSESNSDVSVAIETVVVPPGPVSLIEVFDSTTIMGASLPPD